MIESGYYPPGAEFDPRAPWNQSELDEKDFYVCISQSLSKNTKVTTDDYYMEGGYLDADEGGIYVEDVMTDQTNWKEAYSKEHMTPLELIAKFKSMLKDTIESKEGLVSPTNKISLQYLIDECSEWVEDETEIMES